MIDYSGFVAVCPLGQLTMENIYDMYAMPKHRSFVNGPFIHSQLNQ